MCDAPVGEWKMDERSGQYAYDTSTNGKTGTLTTGPTWVSGKLGSAVNLDGSTAYIDVGTGPSSVKTVSFWVYPKTTTEYFINLTGTSDYIWVNGATLTATGITSPTYYLNGVGGTTAPTLTANQWQHIVITSDTAENASNLDIGRTADANYLEGKIDDVKLYDYARTPAQIAWEFNRGAPVAYYKFNECQGTVAEDWSPNANGGYNNNDGTITAGDNTGTNDSVGTCNSGASSPADEMWDEGTTGKRNASLDFDGTNDYVWVADTSPLRFDESTLDFSLFAWIKRTTTGTEYIISKEDADNDGYRLQFNASNQVTCSEDATDVISSSSITDTDWHHIGCTIDRDGNGQVYIDGKANGTTVSMGTDAMATTTLIRIGTRSYTPTNYFNGQIDDVKIFNYALTPAQIKTEMAGGAVRFE